MGGQVRGVYLKMAGLLVLAISVMLPAYAGTTSYLDKTADSEEAAPGYSIIASANAFEFVERWENILILDLRQQSAFARGHIKNAINLDLRDEEFSKKVGKLDSTRPVLIYSDIDPPVKETSKVFESAGFSEVVYLRDGYRGWKLNNLPTEDGSSPNSFDSSARAID